MRNASDPTQIQKHFSSETLIQLDNRPGSSHTKPMRKSGKTQPTKIIHKGCLCWVKPLQNGDYGEKDVS